MRDLHSSVKAQVSLPPAARTATANGVTVDRGQNNDDFESVMVVVSTGVVTDGTHTVEVQHSDDDATWTAVADSQLQGAEPAIVAADDDTVFELGYVGGKRYVRVVVTVTGAPVTGAVLTAVVLLGHPSTAPVTRS